MVLQEGPREAHYDYSAQELEPWMDRIRTVAEDAHDTYVVTNNHNLGKAVVNAFELRAFLTDKPIDPPRQLLERYPDLAVVVSESRSGGQSLNLSRPSEVAGAAFSSHEHTDRC